MEGDIRYAKQDGVCVLKLTGDIRYTTGPAAVISRSLDTFFDKLFATGDFQDVVVDMTETTAIDSTNLGLLARLYTWMQEHGGRKPTLVSTNPDVTRTLESVGFKTMPYHALVPSFGEWGFILAGRETQAPPTSYPVPTRFLNAETTPGLFHFPADMTRVPSEVNRLNNQVLVRYFEAEWRKVIR